MRSQELLAKAVAVLFVLNFVLFILFAIQVPGSNRANRSAHLIGRTWLIPADICR